MSSKILLVEDDDDIRVDLAELLRAQGLEVAVASDGAQALDTLHQDHAFCLILLDLMMAGMDGWEFRRRQLTEPALAGIPVVIVSAAADVHQQASTLHAAGVMTKPFTMADLLRMIRRHC